MKHTLIARVKGITGNVTIREYRQIAPDHQVALVYTNDELFYVDTKLIEIMEVFE